MIYDTISYGIYIYVLYIYIYMYIYNDIYIYIYYIYIYTYVYIYIYIYTHVYNGAKPTTTRIILLYENIGWGHHEVTVLFAPVLSCQTAILAGPAKLASVKGPLEPLL